VLQVSSGDVVTTLAGADLVLRGLSLRDGSAAVRVNVGSRVELVDGRVRDTSDGISLEGGSQASDPIARAVIRRSLLEGSSDDAVDSDHKAELWIEDCVIRDNAATTASRSRAQQRLRRRRVDHSRHPAQPDHGQRRGRRPADRLRRAHRARLDQRNVFGSNVMAGLG
jgi:hypothetical protein